MGVHASITCEKYIQGYNMEPPHISQILDNYTSNLPIWARKSWSEPPQIYQEPTQIYKMPCQSSLEPPLIYGLGTALTSHAHYDS